MNRAAMIQILEAGGVSRQDIYEFFAQLSPTDEAALRVLNSLIDYSMDSQEIVNAVTGETRAQRAAREAFRYAVAFITTKAARDNRQFDNMNHFRACKAALVELVRLKKLSNLIDAGSATQAQIDDYNTNKSQAWLNAENLTK